MRFPILSVIALVAASCGGSNAASPPPAAPAPPPKPAPPASGLSAFGECLKAKGAVMYSASWCKPCHDQIAWLEGDIKAVKVVECAPDGYGESDECEALKLGAYPTWEFSDGTRVEGAYPPEFLALEIGCPIP